MRIIADTPYAYVSGSSCEQFALEMKSFNNIA